ncbi:MAG: hypothetical protein R3B84_03110 [Zavarzinella sp.]
MKIQILTSVLKQFIIVGLLLVSIYSYLRYRVARAELFTVMNAIPGEVAVDLGIPGTTQLEVIPSSLHHHGVDYYLKTDLSNADLNRIDGSITVQEADLDWKFDFASIAKDPPDSRGYWLCRLNKTSHQFVTITVNEAQIPLLENTTLLTTRYAVCELKTVPVVGWQILAFLSALPAVVVCLRFAWRKLKGRP